MTRKFEEIKGNLGWDCDRAKVGGKKAAADGGKKNRKRREQRRRQRERRKQDADSEKDEAGEEVEGEVYHFECTLGPCKYCEGSLGLA